MAHTHRWRQLHEEFLLGGSFPVGWECVGCSKFVSNNSLTPAGLSGTVLEGAMRLVGPHGGCGTTGDGSQYKEQIVHEDGRLEITR